VSGTSTVRLQAMATDVTLSVAGHGRDVTLALDRARRVFQRVEAACTRFDPAGPLAAVNAAPQQWHAVPQELFDAVGEAWQAHRETEGLFDPRVLQTLLRLGYDRTLPFRSGPVSIGPVSSGPVSIGTASVDGRDGACRPEEVPVRNAVRPPAPGPWCPELDPQRGAVRLGEHPIDLGGIGKGLAVRWAARELAVAGAPYLVEAGGDCCLGGDGPDGDGWRIGVEDPQQAGDHPELVAVLELRGTSCATSSVRVRAWQVNGRPVHHLIDPRTADSAWSGLRSVTVVDPDPARAEVWSKALFLTGRDGIAQACAGRGLVALWVGDDGRLGTSEPIRPLLIWEVERVG
jgi:thiamine biosynthesis lipoprotein